MARIPTLWDRVRSIWGWRAPGGDAVLLSSSDSPSIIEAQGYDTLTPELAECLASVYACNRVLTQSLQTSPLAVERRRRGGEWEEQPNHFLARLWNAMPTPFHTPSELADQVMRGLNLYGNTYLWLERRRSGEVAELIPLDETIVDVDPDERWFRHRDRPAVTYYVDGKAYPHNPDRPDICHVRQNVRPWYPFEGRSPIRALREQIGAGLAATEYQRRVFSQGGHAQIGLQPAPKDQATIVPPEQLKEDAESFRKATTGAATWNRVPVVPAGYNIVQLGISPKDAAYLDLMRWSRLDVCACFRVPPILLGDMEKSTYANVREITRGFDRNTMAPMRMLIGDALHRDVLMGDPGLRVVWRPDLKDAPETAVKVYSEGIKAGFLTPKAAADKMEWTYEEDNPPSDEFKSADTDLMGQMPEDEEGGPPDPGEGPTGDGPDPVDEDA